MKIGDIVTIDGERGEVVVIGNFAGPENVLIKVNGVKTWHKAKALAPAEDKAVAGPSGKGKRSR